MIIFTYLPTYETNFFALKTLLSFVYVVFALKYWFESLFLNRIIELQFSSLWTIFLRFFCTNISQTRCCRCIFRKRFNRQNRDSFSHEFNNILTPSVANYKLFFILFFQIMQSAPLAMFGSSLLEKHDVSHHPKIKELV